MEPEKVTIPCQDGIALAGHLWRGKHACACVIVNPATGVLARYYHYYARFLAEQGFTALTYDYRGIGQSRPARLRGSGYLWRHWGERDFDAVVAWCRIHLPALPLQAVGHSIGGFLPGFADNATHLSRLLTVGAQYAYWRDYKAAQRTQLFVKWHLAMPALTSLCGYFPGKRLGWLEDLPAGVAHEWSFRKARMEESYPPAERPAILARFAAVRAPILAVGLSDDELATPQAIRRGLRYYQGAERLHATLKPADLGFDAVGHFSLFHARHRDGFWRQTLDWLRDGINPWPQAERLA